MTARSAPTLHPAGGQTPISAAAWFASNAGRYGLYYPPGPMDWDAICSAAQAYSEECVRPLADALEPFARLATEMPASLSEKPLYGFGSEAAIMVSDVRRAVAALRLAGRLSP